MKGECLEIPKINPHNEDFNSETYDIFSKELRAIKDPAMRLAIILKDEGESCDDRYSGMDDDLWYASAQDYISVITNKVEDLSHVSK